MKLSGLLNTLILGGTETIRILLLDSSGDAYDRLIVGRSGLDHFHYHYDIEGPLHLFEFYVNSSVSYVQYGEDGLFEIAVCT